jgi:hypothetical protein
VKYQTTFVSRPRLQAPPCCPHQVSALAPDRQCRRSTVIPNAGLEPSTLTNQFSGGEPRYELVGRKRSLTKSTRTAHTNLHLYRLLDRHYTGGATRSSMSWSSTALVAPPLSILSLVSMTIPCAAIRLSAIATGLTRVNTGLKRWPRFRLRLPQQLRTPEATRRSPKPRMVYW